MIPSAADVATQIPAVSAGDSALRALSLLREHGVVVFLDERRRPKDILTSCDMEQVQERAKQGMNKSSSAEVLFTSGGREIFTVSAGDDLTTVAQRIARHGLSTGIVVVDNEGRYLGYVFNSKVREVANQLSSEVRDDVARVRAQFPEAWSSLRNKLP